MTDERRTPLDPAVAAAYSDDEQRRKRKRRPKEKREKAKKDDARSRATYDIPKTLLNIIDKIAEKEGLSASSAVVLLLTEGVKQYWSGRISLDGLKKSSRSPRHDWMADVNAVNATLQEQSQEPGQIAR